MASRFSLEATLSLIDDLTRPYQRTTNRVKGLNMSLTNSFNRLGAGIGRGLKIASGVGLAALGAGLTLATREFINLDESITQAGAKFKDLDVRSSTYQQTLKDLSDAARDVGKDTEFSATDAAGALDKFAMAGFESAQAMSLLRGTTNLATAAGTDLTTAVDIATDSLGAFNLVTDDTVQLEKNLARVSDVMAKTTTTANTSLEEMFESVKAGGPAFTAAGQSVESFAALTGIMANAGVKGQTAGTNLRNIMLKLGKPTSEAAGIMKELGVTTADDAGNFRDIVDILADFEKGLKGMGSEQRTAALATVFGARAVTGVNILLAEGSENLREYRGELENAGGASETMANAMRQSLSNRMKVLKSGVIELGLQFVEAFEVDGRNALDALIDGVQNFDVTPMVEGAQALIDIFKSMKPTVDAIIDGLQWLGTLIDPAIRFLNWTSENNLLKKWDEGVERLKADREQEKINEENLKRQALMENPVTRKLIEREEAHAEDRKVLDEILQKHQHDIYLHSPQGNLMSDGKDGIPANTVQLGVQ